MRTIYPAPGHISHSQISALVPSFPNACALRWALERRLHIPSKGSLAMEMGSCLDDGLNEMLRPALMGRPVELDRGLEAMQERLAKVPDDQFADGDARDKEGLALAVALATFWDTHQDWHGQDVQFRFEVSYEDNPLVGVIDRIDADGTIVDHKLTRSQHAKGGKLDEEWLAERRPQLALYLACLDIAERLPIGTKTKARLEVCYASAKLKTPQWTVAELSIDGAEQLAALSNVGTAAWIRDSGVYPARPGSHCSYCDYQAECREVQDMLSLDIVRVAAEL